MKKLQKNMQNILELILHFQEFFQNLTTIFSIFYKLFRVKIIMKSCLKILKKLLKNMQNIKELVLHFPQFFQIFSIIFRFFNKIFRVKFIIKNCLKTLKNYRKIWNMFRNNFYIFPDFFQIFPTFSRFFKNSFKWKNHKLIFKKINKIHLKLQTTFWNTLHIFTNFSQFFPKKKKQNSTPMNGRNTTLPPNQTEKKPVETRNDSAMLSFRLLKITEATGGLQPDEKFQENNKRQTSEARGGCCRSCRIFPQNVSNPRKFFQIFSPPHTQK